MGAEPCPLNGTARGAERDTALSLHTGMRASAPPTFRLPQRTKCERHRDRRLAIGMRDKHYAGP
jgi:hypothetical protein